MALVDESDLRPAREPARRRSPLLWVLAIVNVAALALVAVLAWPHLNWPWPTAGQGAATSDVSALDPESLRLPSGRTMRPVVFGGFMFEVTRVAYFPDVRSRSVTITVPGKPPQQGIFRVGESFAGGKVRVVDISTVGVVLETDGKQQAFTVDGTDPAAAMEGAGPSGSVVIPAGRSDLFPAVPPGQIAPPARPVVPAQPSATDPQPADSGATDEASPEGPRTIEDLPDERHARLERTDYDSLVRRLPDLFEQDMVLAVALEADSGVPYGLEVKNLRVDCALAAYGLEKGDVILSLNGMDIRRVPDLDIAARSNSFQQEIRLCVWRNEDPVTFVLRPGRE
ncbi:MAG: hypothetical protein IT463_12870 [Planctomycetes bacterium]|nr:hypothetical protein [Planctomycetota bacterium]